MAEGAVRIAGMLVLAATLAGRFAVPLAALAGAAGAALGVFLAARQARNPAQP